MPPEMVIVALPLLTLVTVSVTPLAASAADTVVGDTVTTPVLLEIKFTLVAKFEIRSSNVLVPVHVRALVTVCPINIIGFPPVTCVAFAIVNVPCVE